MVKQRLLAATVLTWMVLLSYTNPNVTSDENPFLEAFVGWPIVSFFAVIVSITLASSGNIHLRLSDLEIQRGTSFGNTKSAVRKSALSLVVILCLALLIAILKPVLPDYIWVDQVSNCASLSLIYLSIWILYDLTDTVLAIP